MSNVMDTLLAADAMAAKLGAGCLNPRLRAAIEQIGGCRLDQRALPSAETVAEAEAQGGVTRLSTWKARLEKPDDTPASHPPGY